MIGEMQNFEYFHEDFMSNLRFDYMDGVSIEELEKIEETINLKFPKAYKEFLVLMGKKVSFLEGIDYSYAELNIYRTGAEGYLYSNFGESGLNFLKNNDVVFISSQGCNHFYMDFLESENPKVHFINEGIRVLKPVSSYKSFTEFVQQLSMA